MDWDEIRSELLIMAAADAELRNELAADGALFRGYHPRMKAMHDAHAVRLASILDAHGWPGESQVGRDGAEAAWLIAQHAIAQPELQQRAWKTLKQAVARGEAPAVQAAMLEDRIRSFQGRPQRYGTQFDWDMNGEMSPLPIQELETVDQRRRALGLRPLAEEIRVRREDVARTGERPPQDWEARQREIEAWCKDTGWRRCPV
jgi:hypothetical protein